MLLLEKKNAQKLVLLWQFYLFYTNVIQVNEYLFHNFGYTLSETHLE